MSSPLPSNLPNASALVAFNTSWLGWGCGSKPHTSCRKFPFAKDKKIFTPNTCRGNTIHASKKYAKDFGKPKWAQAMFSPTTMS